MIVLVKNKMGVHSKNKIYCWPIGADSFSISNFIFLAPLVQKGTQHLQLLLGSLLKLHGLLLVLLSLFLRDDVLLLLILAVYGKGIEDFLLAPKLPLPGEVLVQLPFTLLEAGFRSLSVQILNAEELAGVELRESPDFELFHSGFVVVNTLEHPDVRGVDAIRKHYKNKFESKSI